MASGNLITEITYLIAAALFILSLVWMSSPATARRGVWAGEAGMLLAIAGTLLHHGIVDYKWIAIALVLGTIIGIPLGKVPMTAVPQRTALSHAFGAFCVTLVGTAEFYLRAPDIAPFLMAVLAMEVILGSLTFTGSLMAAGKLQEVLPQRPITYKGQNTVNLSVLAIAVGLAGYLVVHPEHTRIFPLIVAIPLVFGVLMIVPIGGADIPTVISLLNSYAGLSAAAMGFVLNSKLLIVAGALDGSSGFILSVIMSKAMNRSFTNVLFGAFGQVQAAAAGAHEARTVRSATAEEAAAILGAANTVVIVPGYGMAVARAQHDAMLAERHRTRIAIFGLVMDGQHGHRRSNHRDFMQSNLYRSLPVSKSVCCFARQRVEKWLWTARVTPHYSSEAQMFRRYLNKMPQGARRFC